MIRQKKIRVLLIDGKDDLLSILVVRCLYRAGHYDIHCLTNASDHQLRYSIRCKVRYENMDSPAVLLDAVRRYNADYPIDIVIPIQEYMIVMAGKVADELNSFTRLAPSPSPDWCDIVDNKWRFYEMISSTSIRVPRSILSGGERVALEKELSTWNGSFMTKPFYSSGGEGIRKYNSLEALLEALYDTTPSPHESFVIQEWIPGNDIGCSFISKDGEILAHTIQRVTLAQNQSYTCGLGVEFVSDEAISNIATEFVSASKWSGVANMDLRIDARNGDIYLLEINPRYWSTLLGSLAMGINFPEIHCRLALGQNLKRPCSQTGRWINYHALYVDIVNLKRVATDRNHSLRSIEFGQFFADPLYELFLMGIGIRRYIGLKTAPFKKRLRRTVNQPATE